MRRASLVLCGGLVLWVAVPSPTAEACGALPDGQYGLAGSQPLDGAVDVPRDAVLAFEVRCKHDENPQIEWAVCQNNRSLLQIALRSTSDGEDPIVGTTEAFGDSQVWVPSAPLLANETYSVEVQLRPEVGPFAGATTSLSFDFTTGDARLPEILGDGVQQRAEYYDAPVARCGELRLVGETAASVLDPKAICPPAFAPCEAEGTQRAPRLAVRFTAITGGAAELGYAMRMMVTDAVPGNFESLPGGGQDTEWADAPHDLLLGTSGHVAAGSAGELTLDLLRPEREDGDETVCVRALFFDAGGRVTGPKPVCKQYDDWLADAEQAQDGVDEAPPDSPALDAGTGAPDASTGAPDASTGAPDASTGAPDAEAETADRPDATDFEADDIGDGGGAPGGCAARGEGAGAASWLFAFCLCVLVWRRWSHPQGSRRAG